MRPCSLARALRWETRGERVPFDHRGQPVREALAGPERGRDSAIPWLSPERKVVNNGEYTNARAHEGGGGDGNAPKGHLKGSASAEEKESERGGGDERGERGGRRERGEAEARRNGVSA